MTVGDGVHGPVRVVETHSAVVLLAGDRVYKTKKPVDLGFLDFREREQRVEACRRELELNARLAPDVYLDVATLVASDGDPLEPVLIMRRLPDDRRLATLVEQGEAVDDCLQQIARQIADLHARTRIVDAVRHASADALRRNWQDNLDTLRNFADDLLPSADIERAADLALGFVAGREALFDDRAALACDGHGDLLAGDIFCLDDGPRIIDCLDFADHYRLGDPLLDAAFLAMDLEHYGRDDLARSFLDRYAECSSEPMPPALVDHFIAYRAHVRAKVACLRFGQGEEAAAAEASSYHRLCLDHLVAGQVALVVIGGLPGTGKSTVARGVAETQGWTLLSTDEVRKDTLGRSRTERLADEAYSLEARSAVYRELLDRAEELLARGESVVLDGSWSELEWREAAHALAQRSYSAFLPVLCEVPLAVAADRVRRRAERGDDASDADAEVLDRLAERTPPWPDAISFDATGTPAATVRRAIDLVRSRL